jgi:thiosulfate dehydrogenase
VIPTVKFRASIFGYQENEILDEALYPFFIDPSRILSFTGGAEMIKSCAIFTSCIAAAVVAGALGSASISANPAKPTAAARVTSLEETVRQGARIFASDSFGGKQTFKGQPATCTACHSNGGKTEGTLPNGAHIPSLIGAAAEFPKFIPQEHKVITLEQQLVHCIRGGLQGKPPAYDSPQMVDLITYLTFLSKGFVMGKQFK